MMSDQYRPMNPVEIEREILDLSNKISHGVRVFSERYRAFLDADREYDRAYAAAYLGCEDGSIKDREKHAVLATISQREARDVAEVAYKHADKLHRSLSDSLRALQSVGASVRMQYATAGRGEF